MKNKVISGLAAACLIFGLGTVSPAYAIDQVTLTSGEVIQGTVLSDAPHQHVDIRLVNGTSRRIPHDQVANVERDVPSREDYSLQGNTSMGYLGALVGMSINTSTSKTVAFSLGARGGVNVAQMSFAKLAIGLEYNYTKDSSSYYGVGGSLTDNEILAQLLFRKVGNSGFYFGPEGGLGIITVTNNPLGGLFGTTATSSNATSFELGGVLGFDFFLSDSFSLGAEVREDYLFAYTTNGASTIYNSTVSQGAAFFTKVLVSGTFHL